MTETQLISRAEAAELLGVSVRTINRYAAAGYLTPTYERHRGQLVPRYDRGALEELRHIRQASEPTPPEVACH